MTVQWLRTWDAAEDARVKAEAQHAEAEAQRVKAEARAEANAEARAEAKAYAQAKSRVDAFEKAEWNCRAKEQAEYDMFHGTSASNEHDPDAGSSTIGDDEDRCGSLPDDQDYLSDDDEDLLEALYSMAEQESIQNSEDLGPPQKKQKTEGQQSSVTKPVNKPATVIRVRLMGWRKRGNARKALAQERAAKLLDKSDNAIFAETGVGLEDEDQVLDDAEKEATVENLPARFRMSTDPRLGVPAVHTAADVDEKERLERFNETALKIIRFLKSTAKEYWDLPKSTKRTTWQPMVRGNLTLLKNASEEYLLECLLSGISDSVRSTLGKPDFTIDDLVNLPGGSVDQNIEKGVYVDILHLLHGTDTIRQLYVGAAAGKFGLAQRWHKYLTKRAGQETGKHSKELMKEGSTVCLRALARYGYTPYPWLVCFAETFFMLYLGTIEDPGYRAEPGHRAEAYLNDALYKKVKACRLSAGLTSRIAVGLNSTWSLSQGYRWAAYANTACLVCKRKEVSKKDASWEPDTFISCNPERPGESVVCMNCLAYRKKFGFDRTPAKEARLEYRKTVPVPKVCQAPKCSHLLMSVHEQEQFFERCHADDERVPISCPLIGKWVHRIFQHDKILLGKHYWVCAVCQTTQMGYKSLLAGTKVNWGYFTYKKTQALSSKAS